MIRNFIFVWVMTLAFCIPLSMAQEKPKETFRRQWKKIDQLVEKGLPKSAAELARELLESARKRNDGANAIKAQLFIMGTAEEHEEDAAIRNIQQVDSAIQVSDGAEKALWQSIGAELYWRYYQRNRWIVLSRTPIAGEPPADIATWDAASFIDKASALYQASILDRETLTAIPVDQYVPLITEGKNTRHLRPTLYDLLAFRAIEFFQNEEKDVNRPSYQFQLEGTLWFEPAERFSEVKINPANPEALHFRALHTFQQLLAFHLNDERPDALIDADLHRLTFVHRYSVNPDKDSLYREALRRLEARHAGHPGIAEARFRLLEQSYRQITEDDSSAAALPALLMELKALEKRFPGSEGAIHATQLAYDIERKTLELTAEEVTLPMENSKVLVTYRNLNHVYLRLYRIPAEEPKVRNEDEKALLDKWLSLTPLKAWESPLPGSDDLRQHRTEVKIDALPLGRYLLIASAREDFREERNTLKALTFQVSSISMLTHSSQPQEWFFALHRKSGMPLRGARVTFYERQFNQQERIYFFREVREVPTDEDGRVNMAKALPAGQRINRVLITLADDTLLTDAYFNRYPRPENDTEVLSQRTFFFTDRSLYRPGQTIYFKGIIVENNRRTNSNRVLANEKTKVTLYDVNGQEVSAIELTTNAYGSFEGSFDAPGAGLTGAMRIANPSGSADIAVEAYKRPRFGVSFDSVKTDLALNQDVTITGRAEAFAGNAVDGASVTYRIVRETWLPIFRNPVSSYAGFGVRGRPENTRYEIANGVSETAADGSFSITFNTLPDRAWDSKLLPVFHYTVYADVTDVNGETHSGQYTVHAGYRSLLLNVSVADALDGTKPGQLMVSTTNLNGIAIPADVHIMVSPLRFPGKLFRERRWETPDKHVMSETEFRAAFPDDEYKDEGNYRNWPRAESTWQTTIRTDTDKQTTVPATAWKHEGWYLIEAKTKDGQGNTIEENQYTYVHQPDSKIPAQQKLAVFTEAVTVRPGETLRLAVKTGFDSTYVLESDTDLKGDFTAFSKHKLMERPVREADRGGMAYSWLYVHNNRVYTASAHIDVPWSDRDLQLEWATHRDKLLPGETESWTLTVKGAQKEVVAAELLAGLYDASLDVLKPHQWSWEPLVPFRSLNGYWNTQYGFGQADIRWSWDQLNPNRPSGYVKVYDALTVPAIGTHYLTGRNSGIRIRGMSSIQRNAGITEPQMETAAAEESALNETVVVGYGEERSDKQQAEDGTTAEQETPIIPIRTNLRETAFFFPQLQTDQAGNVSFKFTVPEALTEWKLMAFAHTADWKTGYLEGRIKTQKDLMVMPNLPRFFRQGDTIRISAKVSNLSAASQQGTAYIEVLDAATGQPISDFGERMEGKRFTVSAGGSASVDWTLYVPADCTGPVVVRVSAKAGNFTDGEEHTLPVLTNRMLVTETLPLPVRGNEAVSFKLEKLTQPSSPTRVNHALTVEFTGNPAWYAVQALPYLAEQSHESAEQVFNRFYANALAAHIVAEAPRVKAIFDTWKHKDTTALLSNLEKNEALKSALLEETPWVMEGKNETERKQRIARLFEAATIADGLQTSLHKLADLQLADGGFPWFKGMNGNRYITQYIVTGLGRLRKLGVEAAASPKAEEILRKAVDYTDRAIAADYDNLTKKTKNDTSILVEQHISYIQVHYLYMRSFLIATLPVPEIAKTAADYYSKQAAKYWTAFNPYLKGQLALAFHRVGDKETAAGIIASLRETAINTSTLGMYWKSMPNGYWWYEAPIEAQSLLIETFAEVAGDTRAVDDLRVWLLKQKQTQAWNTTKATADAIYALLLRGTDWLAAEPAVTIKLGKTTIRSAKEQTEAGTGYFKKHFGAMEISPDMGHISVKVDQPKNEGIAWGAVYWQYFEDLDNITAAETPLSLRKQLFIQRNTPDGPILEEVTSKNPLRVGDNIKVRIELRADRDMEYVHLKDMRAACFEPVNVLSGYRYQGGLGYFESTRDAATNFFFDYVRKGTYVFEYTLVVSQAGDFSNGISTVQCMYAPEFSSHSEGIRVQVTGGR
jgi:Large extracellular alpha-helical protein